MNAQSARCLACLASIALLAACGGSGATPRTGANPPGPPQFESSGERGAPRPGVYMLSNETDENPSPDAATEVPADPEAGSAPE